MKKRDIMKAFSEADVVASQSRQIVGWMIETLEQQAELGNLDRNGQVHLALGKTHLEVIEEYLAKPIGGEV